MHESILLILIHNAALLITLAYIYSLLSVYEKEQTPLWKKLFMGGVVSAIGLSIMLTSWAAVPGVRFDTRSVLLAGSGLYLGAVPTWMAIVITGVFRIMIGGEGAVAGVGMILISGGIGLLWRRYRYERLIDMSWGELYLFGWATHLALVPLLLLLPNVSDALQLARTVWIPFLLLYPAATMLLGRMLSHRLQRERAAVQRQQETVEQQRLEAQLWQAQKMEAVGRLAGGVAHDYNNKLQVILGYTEIALQREDLAEDLRRFLEEIQASAQHSTLLTMQLMAFARKQPIHPCVSDLNDVIEQLLKMLKQLVGEDIDLAWSPDKDLWAVKVDPSQIDQVLVNLAINAREAMPDTGKLTIETRNVVLDEDCRKMIPESAPGEYVMVAVSDTGRGIEPEVINMVFEPFFTTKREGDGSGLGLAMVYGALQQNGGFAHVHSTSGEGASFQLYFPRTQEPTRKVKPAGATEGPPRGKGETVLLVEDEKLVLDIVRIALEGHGYTVIPADGPAAALKLVAEHERAFDLMVTDVVMPDMNGRVLYEKIAAQHPGMKVIYMSGYTADAVVHRGILNEGITFFQKPFSVEALCAKVHEILQ